MSWIRAGIPPKFLRKMPVSGGHGQTLLLAGAPLSPAAACPPLACRVWDLFSVPPMAHVVLGYSLS